MAVVIVAELGAFNSSGRECIVLRPERLHSLLDIGG
jgi:hypothetical protein